MGSTAEAEFRKRAKSSSEPEELRRHLAEVRSELADAREAEAMALRMREDLHPAPVTAAGHGLAASRSLTPHANHERFVGRAYLRSMERRRVSVRCGMLAFRTGFHADTARARNNNIQNTR